MIPRASVESSFSAFHHHRVCGPILTTQQKFPNTSFKDPNLNIHILSGKVKVVKDEQFISAHFDTSFVEIHQQMTEIWVFEGLWIKF